MRVLRPVGCCSRRRLGYSCVALLATLALSIGHTISAVSLPKSRSHYTANTYLMFGSERADDDNVNNDKYNKNDSATATSDVSMQQTSKTTTTTTTQPLALIRRDPLHLWSSLVAGVGSAALASVLCAPLDLLRTRMQVWGAIHKRGGGTAAAAAAATVSIGGMLRDIVAKEGYRGCFRGLGATLITVPAFWGVYFPLYDDCKRTWARTHPQTNPALIHCGSAVAAGLAADLICNPLFVMRTRLQTQALHNTDNAIVLLSMRQTVHSLYQQGGLLIFWRGMAANLLGLSHVALQFPIYEQLKESFRTMRKRKVQQQQQQQQQRKQQQHTLNHGDAAMDVLIASGLSKMTASLVTYPHEVIRSRMMDARTPTSGTGAAAAAESVLGLVGTCRNIYAAEGLCGFYAGLPISLIRVIPNTCITFLTYELFLQWARTKIAEHSERR